jgi:hypothetical protein
MPNAPTDLTVSLTADASQAVSKLALARAVALLNSIDGTLTVLIDSLREGTYNKADEHIGADFAYLQSLARGDV